MKEYNIIVEEPSAGKYGRITIQDLNNKGLILYLDDIYFVENIRLLLLLQ